MLPPGRDRITAIPGGAITITTQRQRGSISPLCLAKALPVGWHRLGRDRPRRTPLRGDGKRTSDWLGWVQPVRAVAAGTGASLHDRQAYNVVIGSVDKMGGPRRATQC